MHKTFFRPFNRQTANHAKPIKTTTTVVCWLSLIQVLCQSGTCKSQLCHGFYQLLHTASASASSSPSLTVKEMISTTDWISSDPNHTELQVKPLQFEAGSYIISATAKQWSDISVIGYINDPTCPWRPLTFCYWQCWLRDEMCTPLVQIQQESVMQITVLALNDNFDCPVLLHTTYVVPRTGTSLDDWSFTAAQAQPSNNLPLHFCDSELILLGVLLVADDVPVCWDHGT